MTRFCKTTSGAVFVKGPGSDYAEAQDEAEYALRNWDRLINPGEEIDGEEFAERIMNVFGDHPQAMKVISKIKDL